jgi:hypothetical protein
MVIAADPGGGGKPGQTDAPAAYGASTAIAINATMPAICLPETPPLLPEPPPHGRDQNSTRSAGADAAALPLALPHRLAIDHADGREAEPVASARSGVGRAGAAAPMGAGQEGRNRLTGERRSLVRDGKRQGDVAHVRRGLATRSAAAYVATAGLPGGPCCEASVHPGMCIRKGLRGDLSTNAEVNSARSSAAAATRSLPGPAAPQARRRTWIAWIMRRSGCSQMPMCAGRDILAMSTIAPSPALTKWSVRTLLPPGAPGAPQWCRSSTPMSGAPAP